VHVVRPVVDGRVAEEGDHGHRHIVEAATNRLDEVVGRATRADRVPKRSERSPGTAPALADEPRGDFEVQLWIEGGAARLRGPACRTAGGSAVCICMGKEKEIGRDSDIYRER
jgi:hypothetical protein